MTISECFPRIAREDARILILGTLPSQISLREKQYYANPRNAFWKIMCDLIAADHALASDYATIATKIKEKGIALWDVCKAAHREGSLDSAMHDEVANDFRNFFNMYTKISLICFNGTRAEKIFQSKVLHDLPKHETGRL